MQFLNLFIIHFQPLNKKVIHFNALEHIFSHIDNNTNRVRTQSKNT